MARIAPYGTWVSPISARLLVERAVRLGDTFTDSHAHAHDSATALDVVYWSEGRPNEQGRDVLVRRDADGTVADVVPEGFSARTLVHEYGGRCSAVASGVAFFSNFADQRLFALRPGADPVPLTAEPPSPMGTRFAAPTVSLDGDYVVCVRERHLPGTVVNDLVAIATDGSRREFVVAEGYDFYGTPALAPDGTRVAVCCWNHPRMPWDGTELVEIDFDPVALGRTGSRPAPRLVAGGSEESVTQPRYDAAGRLHFISDRTGWWNLYREEGAGPDRSVVALAPMEAEFAGPDWIFGLSSYALLRDGSLVATWSQSGGSRLGVLRPGASTFVELTTPFTLYDSLTALPDGSGVLAVAGSATRPSAVVTIDAASGSTTVLREARESNVDEGYLARPEGIAFPTSGGARAHALLYRPRNADFAGPDAERPPLLVAVHGGPTSAASPALNYAIQFWTSRGFVVADLNYRGSSGYGRAYRRMLDGGWGIVDVEDAEHLAAALVTAGEVDAGRLLIHGGSAGGYTTLCAVTFGATFTSGASYYGVADAAALARDTHKFESRYLDGLIGPWPEANEVYEARSPLFHTDRLRTPLILFQGLEDKVVPPSQAEMMVAALDDKGIPVAYVAYEGEQHGFRRAENIVRTAEAELAFYGCVLGFEPADRVEPVEIRNAEALGQYRG